MIEVQELCKRYGAITALDRVSFRVGAGRIVGFLGPNGAGKSTTMRILTGYFPATSGTARIAGFEVHADPIAVKQRVGYMPERVPLYDEMTVAAFLRYTAEVRGVARGERRVQVESAAERCGLADMLHRLTGHLSKGYRQRVGLAQALIGDPEVLILDEPTAGLDPRQIVEIRHLIRELGRKHTVLLSTHILPEVSMLCEDVIIIDRGRIVMQEAMTHLTRGGGRSLEEVFLAAVHGDAAGAA